MIHSKAFTYLFLTIGVFLCTLYVINPAPLMAANITQLEQQINLLTQEYETTSTTPTPTNKSLGLFYLDLDNYPGSEIFFEALVSCEACSGGNESAQAFLYTSGGSPVTNAAVSTNETSPTRIRSGNISENLTSTGEYTLRLQLDAATGTASVKSARLIIIQSAANITATQTQIELGNTAQTTGDSYTVIAGPKMFRYDTDRYDPAPAVYFEATLASDNASGTAYASLSSSTTCASTVSGSEVTVTGTAWDRTRSGELSENLTDDVDYWVCLKTTDGHTASLASARLILTQSSEDGLFKTQLYHHYISYPAFTDSSVYLSQNTLNLFNPANFSATTLRYYFESVLSTTAGTGYARLYDLTNTVNIASTEISTTTTGFARVRSGNIASYLPSSAAALDTQLKNSGTDTTTASSSWLIIDLERIPDPSLTFSITGVSQGYETNGITTTVATEHNQLAFGNIAFGIPAYAAHQLYVATNAPTGYIVTMQLSNYLQGLYPSNNIDPFIHSWHEPASWTKPTGSTPNDNTGWLGANTSDTRINGWSDAASKFGAVSSSPHIVMQSTQPDSGTTTFVTYALEVNIHQPEDAYSGSLIYNITPLY